MRVTFPRFLHPSHVLRVSCVSACVLIAALPAAAQAPLTLDQAISAALSKNRSLQAARSTVAEAEQGIGEARSGYLPRLTVTESWQRGDQPVFVFSSLLSARQFAAANFAIDALNHPDPLGFFRTSVGVDHTLFDGGRQRSSVAAAGLRREIAARQADEAMLDVKLGVAQTYGRVLTAQAAQRAAQAGVESAVEDVARAERRRDAGMATDADVLSLRVHLADLEQRVIQADGDAAVARAELNHLMGAPIDRSYQTAEPPTPASSAVDRNTSIAAAQNTRPSVKASAAAADLAQAVRRAARASLVPQISAQAAVDVSGTQIADRSSSWLFGGEVRWTFSLGGAELSRLKAASEAASRARIERDDTVARVEVEIVSAQRRLEAARARERVGTAAVAQAHESQRIIRDRFDAGLAGTDEVLRAAMAVLDAEARRIAAVVDGFVSAAMLDRAVGRQ